MAKMYFVAARLDPKKKLSETGTLFVVTPDMPGFHADFFHEKSSQRLATNGTFHFENMRVPAANLLVGEGMLGELRSKYMPGSKAEAAATVLGVGRAAYEYAFAYAKNRIQGGSRIVEHQAVAMMLAQMGMKLDAARVQIWRAAWLADRKDPEARIVGLFAKVMASEVAFECCKLAGEILGGASIMFEHPIEKYLRDASSFMHSDGTNQLCLLRAARAIDNRSAASEYGF
jgi:acyl-CoA dehydrogenase